MRMNFYTLCGLGTTLTPKNTSTTQYTKNSTTNKYTTTPNTASDKFIPHNLQPQHTRLITASASRSTWLKHASALTCFENFESHCNAKKKFPLSEDDICDFIAYANQVKNLKQSTIQSYISSLAFYHRLRKWDDSCFNSFMVKTMLKGAKKLRFLLCNCKRGKESPLFSTA
jgi:hypothetical protein